jgi:urease beta subunit
MIPGETFVQPGEIELKPGRRRASVTVKNTGDRPIQVGSHVRVMVSEGAQRRSRTTAAVLRRRSCAAALRMTRG